MSRKDSPSSPWMGSTMVASLSRHLKRNVAREAVVATIVAASVVLSICSTVFAIDPGLLVGFGETDITPDLRGDNEVWLAGYGMNRRATGVHDPLMARCVIMKEGERKIALVSVDLVGLQFPEVKRIRAGLPDFHYVLVASTHNHEGPDVVGIWGRSPIHRGVDERYLDFVIDRVQRLVRNTEQDLAVAHAEFGTAEDATLVRDTRLPEAKDGIIRVLRFRSPANDTPIGLLVDWSSHPESMGSKNTLVTADFPSATVAHLQGKYACPVVYFSGAVGGLMTPPRDRIRDDQGTVLHEGDFAYMTRYGEEVAELAVKALDEKPQRVSLTPLKVSAQTVFLPVDNTLYRAARALNVLTRECTIWSGDRHQRGPMLTAENADQPMAVETEVACIRIGELRFACIPGELYPELMYGHFQDPVDPDVDYPDAVLEPHVANIFADHRWALIGLANDEVGYIIPRRQWDRTAPYAYGRKESQYGEANSCGPYVAPILMMTLAECALAVDR